ncbi:MAG: YdeI/OmpD-associated family protein [Clostridia bacterium]|nr:YdeI/OmpD-associated family protein [Clostridia bacterium]
MIYRSITHIPYGLDVRLSRDVSARTKFGTLSSEQKARIVSYINNAQTVEERESRTENIVDSLKDSQKMWFYD